MAKYAWCTDIHLDAIHDEKQFDKFAASIVSLNPSGVFLTGDISNAKQLVYHLSMLERVLGRQIYFVLGNHDHWGGYVAETRKTMRDLSNMSQFLKYLPTTQYVSLNSKTALIGHDGWYDALNGDHQKSTMTLNDWFKIGDYVDLQRGRQVIGRINLDMNAIVETSKKLAHAAVTHVHDAIKAAVRYHSRIILLTHVPPFEDSHIFEGRRGTPEAQPWYTSKMMGDMLMKAAAAYPNVMFEVYSGHTHGKYEGNFAKNLKVNVGAADYGTPMIANMIEVG